MIPELNVTATDGPARTGTVSTARGSFRTPCFMPVGTRGAVRAVDAVDLEALGAEVVLANTYHLMLRPGADTVAELGGLHRFTGWNGFMLTDSGGFQVHSLQPVVDDDGVTFRSVYDGAEARLTPEGAVAVQERLGADIQMVLDVCSSLPAEPAVVRLALERTAAWAGRARAAHRREDQALFGIVQGGVDGGGPHPVADDVALGLVGGTGPVEVPLDDALEVGAETQAPGPLGEGDPGQAGVEAGPQELGHRGGGRGVGGQELGHPGPDEGVGVDSGGHGPHATDRRSIGPDASPRRVTDGEDSVESQEFETIIYEKDGPVARIILNTPDQANVQTAQQVWDVDAALQQAGADDEVKVLILKGAGKGFCAGHAIVSRQEMPEVYPTTGQDPEFTWKHHHYDLFLWPALRLWEFPKVTIAQVQGYCVGGGTVYGLLTDLTVVSEDAWFQMPLPQGFGLPGAQTQIEPWVMMNSKRAAEYLFLAPTIDARQALEWGMVNRVVPGEALEETVEEMARTVARMPLTTILATKAGLKRAWEGMGMRLHLQQSTDLVAFCTQATDVRAFMASMEGRRPRQQAAEHVEGAGEAAPPAGWRGPPVGGF